MVRATPRTGIVERESDGSVRRTEVPPEIAAFRLLKAPAEAVERVEEILRARGRFLETFVQGNLDLLSKLDTAGSTNDKLDQAILGLEALAKLAPLTKDGSLRMRIGALLTPADFRRFDAILDEYWNAIVFQERQRSPEKSRIQVVVEERLQSLAREIAAALERIESSGALLFSYLFGDVALSPPQEAEIRTLLDEFIDQTKGGATPEQEQRFFFSMLSKLDPRQQLAVVSRANGRPLKSRPARKQEEMNGATGGK
jgi:hypothetical protein